MIKRVVTTAIVLAAVASLAPATAAQTRRVAEKAWQPARTADGQPDLQGHWSNQGSTSTVDIEGTRNPANSPLVEPADKKLPYQPWALARRDEIKANHLDPKGKIEYVDSETRCLPVGVPRINYATPYNGYQFLQKPGAVVMLAEWNHTYRIIPVDGRPHLSPNIRLWMGDPRGRWDGHTLVVDVTNFTDKTQIDEVGNFHSDALHVVERYTIADSNTIHYEATLDDSKVFTRPVKMAMDFKRATVGTGQQLVNAGRIEDASDPKNAAPGFFKDTLTPTYELFEYACREGDKALENIFGAEIAHKIMTVSPIPPGPLTR